MGMGAYNPTVWRVNPNPTANAGAIANLLGQMSGQVDKFVGRVGNIQQAARNNKVAGLLGDEKFQAMTPEQKMIAATQLVGGGNIDGSAGQALGMLLGNAPGAGKGPAGLGGRSGRRGSRGVGGQSGSGGLTDVNKQKAFNAYMDLLQNPDTPKAEKVKLINEMQSNGLWNRNLGFAVKYLLGGGALAEAVTGKKPSSSRQSIPLPIKKATDGMHKGTHDLFVRAYQDGHVTAQPKKDSKGRVQGYRWIDQNGQEVNKEILQAYYKDK